VTDIGLPPGVVVGECCVCHAPKALIAYCKLCDAWICGLCRNRYRYRVVAWWKKMIGQGGKCGPSEDQSNSK
jgi:hypothetical protein